MEVVTTLLDLAESSGCRLSLRDCWDVAVGGLVARRRAQLPPQRMLAMAGGLSGWISGTVVGVWHGPRLLASIAVIGMAMTATFLMASTIRRNNLRDGSGHGSAGVVGVRSAQAHQYAGGDLGG